MNLTDLPFEQQLGQALVLTGEFHGHFSTWMNIHKFEIGDIILVTDVRHDDYSARYEASLLRDPMEKMRFGPEIKYLDLYDPCQE